MALTEHQQDILNESLEILEFGNRLLIKGSAGVGKTYMVNELVKQLNTMRLVYCSAPTNKAVSVLKGKVDKSPNLNFITTHSAMKLKRQINYKTGEVSFKPSFSQKYPPLQGVGLLIVDEASMLNSELLEYIEEYSTMYNVKVIFIGDYKQLNPVGEEESPVFISDYPEVELIEIIRQGEGNPIIDLSRNLPLVKSGNPRVMETDHKYGYMYSRDKEQVIQTLAKVNGTDELKYLAYTNVEVDKMNFLVRREIYGNPKKIEIGETLIFNSPFKDLHFTNEEIKVENTVIREKEFKYIINKLGKVNPEVGEDPYFGTSTLKYYSINPRIIGEKVEDYLIVIHEDSELEYKKLCKGLKDKAKIADIGWRDYYEFIEQFADLKYNHALTVHKSQGSTYKQTIINVRNLFINRNEKERNRLIYTGITRASELLILYNY